MNRRQFLKLSLATVIGALMPGTALPLSSPIVSLPHRNRWLSSLEGDEFAFLALGDMGTGWQCEYDLVALMAQSPAAVYSAILLLGDLLYPSAKAELLEPNLVKPFTPLIERGFRFYPVWGNHDWIEREAQVVKDFFVAPNYYSFRLGPAQFWALNSNNFNPAQASWLEGGLRTSQARWKIVALHHSPYSSGVVHHSNQHLIQHLCPLLSAYRVDLCLSGHNHLYERTEKINNVVYITSGGGSASLHKFDDKVDFPCAKVKSCHHFLRIAGNWSSVLIQAVERNGQIFDECVISK